MLFFFALSLFLTSLLPFLSGGVCPGLLKSTPPSGESKVPKPSEYEKALSELDINAVIDDIRDLLKNSQSCWPADEFHGHPSYGPLFIRLAWHCSGTFRATDGVGGCAGGRQRFEPEASWDDNTNLDKARALLTPIKEKYGIGLSWGDLFIFAGSASIIDMNGPIREICAGRIDSFDGNLSLPLGPSSIAPPCKNQGNCERPLGSDTTGLIYVNPEGFMGKPDPKRSSIQIREIFDRMDMNDEETVALIGGGHAFGKSHGACPLGAGLPPNKQPNNPWPGNCGNGKGLNTYTSGIEGQWTSNPLKWDNEFFKLLVRDKYRLKKGPGNKFQWQNKKKHKRNLMMLTTDMALIYDKRYRGIVRKFARDINKLNKVFRNAWYKLVRSGGTWAKNKKCVNYKSTKGEDSHSMSDSDSHSHSQSMSMSDSDSQSDSDIDSISMNN